MTAATLIAAAFATSCGGSDVADDAPADADSPDSSSSDTANNEPDAAPPAADQADESTNVDFFGQQYIIRQAVTAEASNSAGEPVGFAFEYTEISGPKLADGRDEYTYESVSVNGEIREAQLFTTVDEVGKVDSIICSNKLGECLRGTNPFYTTSYATFIEFGFEPVWRFEWPAPVNVLFDTDDWVMDEGDVTVAGMPGVCFTSTGGDRPAGDRICGFLYGGGLETNDVKFLSYDQGGDGSFEVEGVLASNDVDPSQAALPFTGRDTPIDDAALEAASDQILEFGPTLD